MKTWIGGSLLLLSLAMVACGQPEVRQIWFQLLPAGGEVAAGPFLFEPGTRIKLGPQVYVLQRGAGRMFFLRELAAGVDFGPFELVNNRIIDVGGSGYTVIGIEQMAVPVAPPVRPASSGPVSQKRTPTPDVPPRGRLAPQPAPSTKGSFGVEFFALQTAYDWSLGAARGEDKMERTGVAVPLQWGLFSARLGLITASKWSGKVDGGSEQGFFDVQLRSGKGWLLEAGLHSPLYTGARWHWDAGIRAGYSRETLSLEYSILERTETEIPADADEEESVGSGTNTATQVEVLYAFTAQEDNTTLTDIYAALETKLSYRDARWEVYGLVRAVLWEDCTLSGKIQTQQERYPFEMERSGAVTAMAGAQYATGSFDLFAEAALLSVTGLRIGVLWTF